MSEVECNGKNRGFGVGNVGLTLIFDIYCLSDFGKCYLV